MLNNIKIPGVAKLGELCMIGDDWLMNFDTAKLFRVNPQGKYELDHQIEDRDRWTDPLYGDTYQTQRGKLVIVQKHKENFVSLCPSWGEGLWGFGRKRGVIN